MLYDWPIWTEAGTVVKAMFEVDCAIANAAEAAPIRSEKKRMAGKSFRGVLTEC